MRPGSMYPTAPTESLMTEHADAPLLVAALWRTEKQLMAETGLSQQRFRRAARYAVRVGLMVERTMRIDGWHTIKSWRAAK